MNANLRSPLQRRLAGAECGSGVSQFVLSIFCEWVRATEHAPGAPIRLLERIHGLAEIGERGVVVTVERNRVAVTANASAAIGALSTFNVCRVVAQGTCFNPGSACWFHHSRNWWKKHHAFGGAA